MSPFELSEKYQADIKRLKGPILILGAGGFIGINLLNLLLLYRKDVYGVSQNPNNNWRFAVTDVARDNLIECDLTQLAQVDNLIEKIAPQTVFNLAAYGAYSKQEEYKKIYDTNFNAAVDVVEILKKKGFTAYVYAGSSSEYGQNSAAPREQSELVPNSHYAISKTAAYYANKYYGKVEKLPIIHLRLYSVYGPWEEPDRLMPVLIAHARKKDLPDFVDPYISRDFVYITDITAAFIKAAAKMTPELYGEAFNIGTGQKTTILALAKLVKKKFRIQKPLEFGKMPNRNWDTKDWFANPVQAEIELNWKAEVKLEDGIMKIAAHQQEVDFDNAYWNYTNK